MASNLQVVVDIQSRQNGFLEANAQLEVMRVNTEKLNTAGQNQVSLTQQLLREEAAHTAELTQQAAIGSQSQVIAQTRLDLVAATVKGDEAQAAILRSELQVREATLGVMRAEVLSAAELNALTESESALLATAGVGTQGVAAGSLIAGANLNKAKGEAIVLAREIATGSVNARTLGALLGSLGTTITIAALAGYELYQVISHAGDAALEVAKNDEKMATELHKAVDEWVKLARTAQSFGDEVKLADKVQLELDKMAVEMSKVRAEQLPLWKKFFDEIGRMAEALTHVASVATFGLIPDIKGNTFQAELDKQKAEAQERYNRAVLDANLSIDLARQKTVEWAAAEANLPQGLADYSQRLSEAQTKLDELDTRRRANLTDPSALAAFNAQLAVVDDLKGKVNQLGDELDKNNRKHKEGRTEIVAFGREVSSTLQAIRQQQQLVSQNPFLTIDEKNARLLTLMRAEIATLNDEVAKGQILLKGGTLDAATYEQVAQKVQQARFEIELLTQKTQTLNFAGGLRENLTSWVNSFGTAAQQVGRAITDSINTSLDATSQLLTGMIFRTGNWRQTVLQAEQAIVGSLIKIGLQMLFNATLGKLLTRQNAADQTAAGAQIAAANAPAAAATSIASFGSSAIVGAIAAAAAIAAIIALLVGFEGGGHTGFAGTKRIAGVVHGNEFVQPDPAVRFYGLNAMEAIRQRRIPAEKIQELLGNYRYAVTPRLGSFEVGGAVAAIEASSNERASAGGAGGPVTIKGFKTVVLNDVAKLRKEIFDSDEAIVFVIDAVAGNAHLVKGAIASS